MSSRIHEWRERIQQDQENARAAIVAATSIELIRRRRKYYRDGVQVSSAISICGLSSFLEIVAYAIQDIIKYCNASTNTAQNIDGVCCLNLMSESYLFGSRIALSRGHYFKVCFYVDDAITLYSGVACEKQQTYS